MPANQAIQLEEKKHFVTFYLLKLKSQAIFNWKIESISPEHYFDKMLMVGSACHLCALPATSSDFHIHKAKPYCSVFGVHHSHTSEQQKIN